MESCSEAIINTVAGVEVVPLSLQLSQAGALLHDQRRPVRGGEAGAGEAGRGDSWSQAEDRWQVVTNGEVCHQEGGEVVR